jgi:hypothetical protein
MTKLTEEEEGKGRYKKYSMTILTKEEKGANKIDENKLPVN